MKGVDGKVKVAGFYNDAIDLTIEERTAIDRVPFDEAQYISDLGISDVFGEEGYSARQRLWARPTFELNGIWGGGLAGQWNKDHVARTSLCQNHLPPCSQPKTGFYFCTAQNPYRGILSQGTVGHS